MQSARFMGSSPLVRIVLQILGAAVAGFVAGGQEAPGAGSAWGAFWGGAEEDSLGGSPAEELVQAMRSPRSKVGCQCQLCSACHLPFVFKLEPLSPRPRA